MWRAPPGAGLNLIISAKQRIVAESVDRMVKNYHWLDLVMGQLEAYDHGAETAVVIDAHGNIKEGPGSNIFAVNDSVLATPADGVLEGVTRKTTIELATRPGYRSWRAMQMSCLSPALRVALCQ